MISNETLLHTDPLTGKPQAIGLGWLDDSMGPRGPSEEDHNYIADTGATPSDIAAQVGAYQASMLALMGGAQLAKGVLELARLRGSTPRISGRPPELTRIS